MDSITKKIRAWCLNNEELYKEITNFVRDHRPAARFVLIDFLACYIRDLITEDLDLQSDVIFVQIYKDLLDEVDFTAIATEFVDDVLSE